VMKNARMEIKLKTMDARINASFPGDMQVANLELFSFIST